MRVTSDAQFEELCARAGRGEVVIESIERGDRPGVLWLVRVVERGSP